MSAPPQLLVLGPPSPADWLTSLRDQGLIHTVSTAPIPFGRVPDVDGALILGPDATLAADWSLLSNILQHAPEAIVVINDRQEIRWHNSRVVDLELVAGAIVGISFSAAFNVLGDLDAEASPFMKARRERTLVRSVLASDGNEAFLEIVCAPLATPGMENWLVIVVRDVTMTVRKREKIRAVHKAGLELGATRDELTIMSLNQRTDLLKQRIIQFTQEVLEFETCEIRLLQNDELMPLLNVGMTEAAATKRLFRSPTGNGVTGFVAYTGQSYLCADTVADEHYLPGAPNACSSLTVPLLLHDQVIGTFNVETAQPGKFDEDDLLFLELFSNEVAVALNTLELLAYEKVSAASANTELVLRTIATPIDQILNDATLVMDQYFGHDPNLVEKLRSIIKQTREIRQLIHKVGETIADRPLEDQATEIRPKLKGKRILVVDNDQAIRDSAHDLLPRFGCEVETTPDGASACRMIRLAAQPYHVAIADIRLGDMNGYQVFKALRELSPGLPVILMTGYGWDSSHSIVNARQEGLKSVLYKPFRIDQLIREIENSLE